MSGRAATPASPKTTCATFVALAFLLSIPPWVLLARLPEGREILPFTMTLMWCPAFAAFITRWWQQRNLGSLGFTLPRPRWVLLGLLVPVAAGLLMFGAAWLSGIAPFDPAKLPGMFTVDFLQLFAVNLGLNWFAALGEEIGWRGLLVPEMARWQSYTRVSLLSGLIWFTWHVPVTVFGFYHGAGSLSFSLLTFAVIATGLSFAMAWMRLASGSVFVAMMMHGTWNYFIQSIYPELTVKTPAGATMLGEFGWAGALVGIVVGAIFWSLRAKVAQAPA